MRGPGVRGRPKKSLDVVRATIPKAVADRVQRLVDEEGLSRDAAWERLLLRSEALHFVERGAGVIPPGVEDRAPALSAARKRERGAENEPGDEEVDAGSVSNDELSDYVSSVASAPDALADASDGDMEEHVRLVAKLRADVARLKRKLRPSFDDLLDKKAGAYCKLMTGLSRGALVRVWERYGQYFEDATFTVTPVPLKSAARTSIRRSLSASSSSLASSDGFEGEDEDDDDIGDDENGGDNDNEDGDGDEQPLTQPQEPVYLRRQGRLPTLPPKDRLYLLLRHCGPANHKCCWRIVLALRRSLCRATSLAA